MVLVDTTVWSMAFRRKPHNLNLEQEKTRMVLASLIEANHAQLLGAVRQEMLSGLRERPQYERVRELLRAFRDVPLEREDYEEAGAVSNACRSKGIAGNSVDFLICSVSIRRNWPIFTLDRDFGGYASYLPIQIHSASAS
jgi:predicted nucleic acid-binding protein